MKAANHKYKFLKTYYNVFYFMKKYDLVSMRMYDDDDVGMVYAYCYYYPKIGRGFRRSKNIEWFKAIVATTAHHMDLKDCKVSLVTHSNTRLYPDPFLLVHR